MISSFFSPLLIFYYPLYISVLSHCFPRLRTVWCHLSLYYQGQESIPCGNHSFLELLRITQHLVARIAWLFNLKTRFRLFIIAAAAILHFISSGKFVDVLGFPKTALLDSCRTCWTHIYTASISFTIVIVHRDVCDWTIHTVLLMAHERFRKLYSSIHIRQ